MISRLWTPGSGEEFLKLGFRPHWAGLSEPLIRRSSLCRKSLVWGERPSLRAS